MLGINTDERDRIISQSLLFYGTVAKLGSSLELNHHEQFKHVAKSWYVHTVFLNSFAKDINVSVIIIGLSNYLTFESFPQNLTKEKS